MLEGGGMAWVVNIVGGGYEGEYTEDCLKVGRVEEVSIRRQRV